MWRRRERERKEEGERKRKRNKGRRDRNRYSPRNRPGTKVTRKHGINRFAIKSNFLYISIFSDTADVV